MNELASLRSMLFVPVLRRRFLDGSRLGDADAIILDLEDSIPPDAKGDARAALEEAVATLKARRLRSIVRVNADDEQDLRACANAAPWAVMVPKVVDADQIALAAARLAQGASTRLIAAVESAAGLLNAASIAHQADVRAICFGAGDFALDCKMACRADVLLPAAIQVVVAARSAGIPAFGLPGPIGDPKDMSGFERLCLLGRAMGFDGTPVIHPDQALIVDRCFSPSPQEIEAAHGIVAEFEASDGLPSMGQQGFIEWATYRAARKTIEGAGLNESPKRNK